MNEQPKQKDQSPSNEQPKLTKFESLKRVFFASAISLSTLGLAEYGPAVPVYSNLYREADYTKEFKNKETRFSSKFVDFEEMMSDENFIPIKPSYIEFSKDGAEFFEGCDFAVSFEVPTIKDLPDHKKYTARISLDPKNPNFEKFSNMLKEFKTVKSTTTINDNGDKYIVTSLGYLRSSLKNGLTSKDMEDLVLFIEKPNP